MLSRPSLRDERGFTLIELLVTMLVTAVAVMAVVGTFDYSRKLVTTAEKNEVASHYAEAEMERVQALDFQKIALLPGAASHSSDPNNPDFYVNGAGYRWDQGPTGPQIDNLVTSGTADVAHTSNWTDPQARLSGTVYRYVTEVGGTSGDAKRVTIAVTVSGRDLKKPVLMSSVVTNPKAGTG